MSGRGLGNTISVLVIMVIIILILSNIIYATPLGPTKLINISTTTKNTTSQGAKSRTDARSTITTLKLNLSQQTSKWKAYVGNISGKLTLDDALNYTIYDWAMSGASGEVYATRSSAAVSWSTITCATNANVENEQSALKHPLTAADSLNKTFKANGHPAFFAGPTTFTSGQCTHTTNLYKADVLPTAQTWHEILLYDGTNLVYTSIINATHQGYNPNNYYDFQMIVAENGSEGSPVANKYYFYVELT